MTTHTIEGPDAAAITRGRRRDREDGCARSSAAPGPAAGGMFWFAGWLFTIGFVQLVWWKALLGLLLWPYFLGVAVR